MRLFVIGSGEREHALVWKLAQSPLVEGIWVASGNGGTAVLGQNIPIPDNDIPALVQFAQENRVDLTIVGPEAPLAAGIVDAFQAGGLAIFGPVKKAAQLESSKAYAKQFMREQSIPTGEFAVFTEFDDALAYLEQQSHPVVIKASGLAAPGYPGMYPKGMPINGLDSVPEDLVVFHAGTAVAGDKVITNGGRVLAVTASGADLETAVRAATGQKQGYCNACFSGKYPIDIPDWLFTDDRDKVMFESMWG